MKFREWLKRETQLDITQDIPDLRFASPEALAATDPDRTQSFAKDKTRVTNPLNRLAKDLAQELKPLDVESPEGDLYQLTLRIDVLELFQDEPEVVTNAQKLMQVWGLFRNQVLRYIYDSGNRSYMSSNERPIRYYAPLDTLRKATQVFQKVEALSGDSTFPNELRQVFRTVHALHSQLMQNIEERLAAALQRARNNPANYEPNAAVPAA